MNVTRKYAKDLKVGDKINFASEGWIEVVGIKRISDYESLAPCCHNIEIVFADGDIVRYNRHAVFEAVANAE